MIAVEVVMRGHHVALGALALAFGIGCGAQATAEADADAKTNADASAKAEAKAPAVDIQPRIGGTIVAAGEYYVEILAFVDGRIEASVMDAKGELVAYADGKLQLSATLAAKADAKAKVDLAWDVELARFVGQVDAELVPGPLAIELTVDGKVSAGALAELGLAAHAHHGGQMMVAGAWSIEIAARGGFVHAYVFDISGRAHAKGDLELHLDAGAKLDLHWDPPSASYKAKLEGGLELEGKPLVLRVAAQGKVAIAAVASFHASARVAIADEVAAHANVDGDAGLKAGAHGSAKSGAKVEVHEHAGASGKASAKAGAKASGGIKASIGGSAKGGIKIGG
jgi:hypothetical protein